MNTPKYEVPILFGPTASGKSARALELAKELSGIIINADAMQCYESLPILTAQPGDEDFKEVPHRLYGIVPAIQNCTVIDWQKMALQEIHQALDQGQAPILVGGTGFFIKALIEGLSPVPDIPAQYRRKAEEKVKAEGLDALYHELYNFNPEHAQRFDRYNRQRVIRAWEVLSASGRTLQEWQDLPRTPPDDTLDFKIFPVTRSRDTLLARINERFDRMIENGALEEVQALNKRIESGEVPEDALVTKAHGFRPLRKYLNNGQSLEAAIERSKIETRQYAKRQMTWLRGQFKPYIPK